jgi:hypothetical protein
LLDAGENGVPLRLLLGFLLLATAFRLLGQAVGDALPEARPGLERGGRRPGW